MPIARRLAATFSLRRSTRWPRSLVVALAVVGGLLLGTVLLALGSLAGAAGFWGARTYLVVSQDPAELEPYGGYVGAYGQVVVKFGRVISVSYGDSKNLDDPRVGKTHLYAASTSPDFRTAGRAMADAYGELTDTRPDGVVALDPNAFDSLLPLIGPLVVSGEPEPVTTANLLGLVLKHTQNFDDPNADRKQFVYALGAEIAARVRKLSPTAWPAVLSALGHAADERHVQLYLQDAVLGWVIHHQGWDGAYPPPTDDFLAVVDSNVSYNKANLVTDQALDYHVAIGADGLTTATLTIAYDNRDTDQLGFSTTEMPYLYHASYDGQVKVYVPLGSQLLAPSPARTLASELERAVFAGEVSVPPRRQRQLTLRYLLPRRPVSGRQIRYDLLVRKQAGTAAVPLSLGVAGPDGWRAAGGGGQDWTTTTTLAVDKRFEVVFERATAAD